MGNLVFGLFVSLLSDEDRAILRNLTAWVRGFAIMYATLWTTLVLAFFALLVHLHGV
jgi:hypothetical protein